ncbi:TPA: helix-turn-helix domain-containing protein [Klebsiella pneumoniae]
MEQHAGDFSVTVRDVRQLTQPESDLLTLLWVLEGSVNLAVAEGASQPLAADGLAIVNRNRRWSLRSAGANAVMILTLSANWLARLDNAFFAVDYQITPRTRDADDGLRRLMRQLLVSGLVNHPGHYRLEANRWLSEIALLLATRFSQPIASTPRRDTEKWSRRIASVVARIDANYQRRLSLHEVAAAEFVSEAWLSRLFRKEVGVSFVQYLTALRLRHAADQLLTTRKTVQQIAREQGFASTRMMSDLFKRQHGVTPRQYREQHPLELARPRPPQADRWQPVAADRLYARLNEPEPRDRESPPLPINPPQTREINLRERPARPAALRHTRMVVTVRELDDLLREDVRQAAWRQQRGVLHRLLPQPQLGIWHRFAPSDPGNDPLFHSPLLAEADFLACQADANEQLDLAQADSRRLASSEHYPLHKLRQIHSALRQRQLNLPLWLLSWNTLTGDTRDTNGRFFRGALLMDNLLGVADQVWLAGFWLNSGLQGEARANGKLDTSSLALHYLHGLPRPVYWVLWLWRRLRGEILVHDKNLLLLHHQGHYQLLLRNTVVYNPWLSSEAAFIQRFSQPYSVRLQGLDGSWRIKQHLFDQHHGALFPLVDAFRSRSGPDAEDYQWLMHQARPALSVDEARLDGYWLRIDSLQSNALVLYEFTPQLSSGADPAP